VSQLTSACDGKSGRRARRPEARQIEEDDWRFWERWADRRGIVIDRPRGGAHPLYPDMIYPCDYGHVVGTAAADGDEIDAFVGQVEVGLVGVVALTHRPSGIADPKLLVNLSREVAEAIVACLDRGNPRPDLKLVWRERN
jgi:hypothetical protein